MKTDDFTAQQEKNLARLANFRLMDDTFMRVALNEAKEAVELILNIILQRTDLVVTSFRTQEEYPNMLMHAVCLDVTAENADTVFDIEIQKDDSDSVEKRSRYNSSMLDTKLLPKGEPYKNLRETYVIFICENDIFKEGLPMYHINRTVEELGITYADAAHIILVNGQYQNLQEPIGRLMHDFHCSNAEDVFYPQLKERIQYFKEDGGGKKHMCRIMEEMCREAEQEKALEIAYNMILENDPSEKIVRCTGLTLDEVETLRKKMLVNA